jgi:uncharacterized protein (DUF1778 family)
MSRRIAAKRPVAKPKKSRTKKSARVAMRLSPYALKIIKRAAQIEGRRVNTFIVAAAEEAAAQAIERSELIVAAIDHQRAFSRAVLAPPNTAK